MAVDLDYRPECSCTKMKMKASTWLSLFLLTLSTMFELSISDPNDLPAAEILKRLIAQAARRELNQDRGFLW